MKQLQIFCILFFSIFLNAQDSIQKVTWSDKYREDQFYLSIHHDLFLNIPSGFKQNALSLGLSTGFLRDMPFSKNRKFAFAPGLGLAYKRHNTFTIPDETSAIFTKSIINQWMVELPIEWRWRNSTVESTQFLRVHLGAKLSYNLYSDITLINEATTNEVNFNGQDYLNSFAVQNYLAFGYSSFNLYVAYSYTPFFKNATVNNERLNAKTLSLGFIFYIL